MGPEGLATAQRLQLDPFGFTILRCQGSLATLVMLNHPAGGERLSAVAL